MPYYLTEQKKSYAKGVVYGEVGEEITVLSKSADPLWAVQGSRHKFHIHKDKLSETRPKVEPIIKGKITKIKK